MKNMLMNDRRGKMGPGIKTTLWIGGVLAAIILLVTILPQSQSGGTTIIEETGACPVEPYIDITIRNASIQSQTVSATFEHRVNGEYKGALTTGSSGTTFSVGDQVEVLATETNHLDKLLAPITIARCGSNSFSDSMYRSDGVNITVYNSGGDAVTDSSENTPINQTTIAAGTSKNLKIELSSLGDQSVDPLWLTVEIFNKTLVKDIRLSAVSSGLTIEDKGKALPSFASVENSTGTSYIEMYKISGIANEGAVSTLTMTIEASAAFAITLSPVYMTPYTEQAFVNIDGTFTTGIEDSDGNAKYDEAATDYDFRII